MGETINHNEKRILKNELNFKINSDVNLLSSLSENNKVQITSEDEKIDTSKLGEQELNIKYIVDNKEKEQSVKINIIDTKVPTIKYKNTLSTTKGTKINLLKDVTANNNNNNNNNLCNKTCNLTENQKYEQVLKKIGC